MDAKESIFRNSGAAMFGRDKTDILKEKYHLRERTQVPAPGKYNAGFSDFSGLQMGSQAIKDQWTQSIIWNWSKYRTK